MDAVYQRCIDPSCAGTLAVDDTTFVCPRCGGLLDVAYDWARLRPPASLRYFESCWARRHDPLDFSGVWRFRELLPFADPAKIVTIGEGQTLLQRADAVAGYVGLKPGCLFLQYEGLNPVRQLQGQRHVRGLHPCPHGRGPPGGLRLHRQHQRLAGPVSARPPG